MGMKEWWKYSFPARRTGNEDFHSCETINSMISSKQTSIEKFFQLKRVDPVIDIQNEKLPSSIQLNRKRLSSLLVDEVVDHDHTIDPLHKPQNYTPLEEQISTIRKAYGDCLLMVECGYRMRFFGDDAVIAGKVLNIRPRKSQNFLTASIPTMRAAIHCQRLLNAGHKVSSSNFYISL